MKNYHISSFLLRSSIGSPNPRLSRWLLWTLVRPLSNSKFNHSTTLTFLIPHPTIQTIRAHQLRSEKMEFKKLICSLLSIATRTILPYLIFLDLETLFRIHTSWRSKKSRRNILSFSSRLKGWKYLTEKKLLDSNWNPENLSMIYAVWLSWKPSMVPR